jgi:hypothetical protein
LYNPSFEKSAFQGLQSYKKLQLRFVKHCHDVELFALFYQARLPMRDKFSLVCERRRIAICAIQGLARHFLGRMPLPINRNSLLSSVIPAFH